MLGPQLNKNNYSFSPRDSLGIEGVAASMSADVCPIVNTVTPRAFYWPFMVWIYYDFYKYSGIKLIGKKKADVDIFDRYLKRQDYFFVMASLLVGGDENNLVGKMKASEDIKGEGPYPFNPKYFQPRYGGMQYYNAGCLTMRFITDRDENGKSLSLPKLTPAGEEMALSFRDVIKDTEYYKHYRLGNAAVPKDVLIEYGNVISLNMKGFEKSKELLKKRLFEPNAQIQKCTAYLKYLHDDYGITDIALDQTRKTFFDHISPSGKQISFRDDLYGVMKAWEIIIGRMYFSAGLEMIWKPMLELIVSPATLREWIGMMLESSELDWSPDDLLGSVLGECYYSFEEREGMIRKARLRRVQDPNTGLQNGLRIMLSIYNWLNDDMPSGDEKELLYYGSDNNSISLAEFIETVNAYKDLSIREFMLFIMENWLIRQHYITAFEKTLYNINGFFYEIVDDKYHKTHDFGIEFQRNRMIQLLQVMKDLDML